MAKAADPHALDYGHHHHHHPHRPHPRPHRSKRHPPRDDDAIVIPGSFPVPDEPVLRSHPSQYYRYASSHDDRVSELPARASSDKREDRVPGPARSRRRRPSVHSRSRDRVPPIDHEQSGSEEEYSGDVYVQSPRRRDASARYTSSYEEMVSHNTASKSSTKRRSSRQVEEGMRLSRSNTTKTKRQHLAERVAPPPRLAVEEVTEQEERRVPGAFDASPELPRLTRSTSLRDGRLYMTRPSIKRSHTVTRPRSASVQALTRRPRAGSIVGKNPVPAPASPKESRKNPPRLLSGLLFHPPAPPKPEKKYDCVVCMADDIPAHRSAKLSCSHRMCNSCLKRQFELSVTDPQHMPPTCCTADHIPLKHVDKLFDHNFKVKWNKKYQEYTTKNRIYCPNRGCGEWIKPSHIKADLAVGRKYGKCGRCRMKVCIMCNGKWHAKKECPKDEDTKRFVEVAKQKGWQRCYNCKAMVELKEGCNHMTCRCTAQFCMICGLQWKTCNCPWFNYTDATAGDRNDIVIPEALRIVIQDGPATGNIPPGAWPPVAGAIPPPPPPPPLPPAEDIVSEVIVIDSARPRSRRTRQERTDALLSRHFQEQLHVSAPSAIDPIDVEVFGVGNAGMHHMNDSFTMRPAMSVPTTPPVRTRRSRMLRTRESARTPAAERPPPRASAMAGLAQDGSRRGAGRVGKWLKHVVHDPAEVEGRAQEQELY